MAGVRPTTERVRAAIFNILDAEQVMDRRVLDLYAGTGSLGIEALSRGAIWCDFVERNRRQSLDLEENLQHTGYAEDGHVYCAEVSRWLALSSASVEPHHLALLDPPYRMGDPTPTLQALSDSRTLHADATVVVGHSSRMALPEGIGALRRYDRRSYGDNAIAFYTQDSAGAA